jgi:hypothetical protein
MEKIRQHIESAFGDIKNRFSVSEKKSRHDRQLLTSAPVCVMKSKDITLTRHTIHQSGKDQFQISRLQIKPKEKYFFFISQLENINSVIFIKILEKNKLFS